MKVYVVTQVSYSYYQIRGIFGSQEKAEAFKNMLGDADRGIEEFELNEIPPWVQRGKACFRVIIYPPDLNRKGECYTRVENIEEDLTEIENVPIETEEDHYDDGSGCRGLLFRVEPVWADSWTAAVKIASEKRAAYIAKQGGEKSERQR